MIGLGIASLTLATCHAAEPYEWGGLYVGGYDGYAAGSSHWSASEPDAAALRFNGTLDFYKPFDFFKGTGSSFSGLQAGYDYIFPSHLVIGTVADISFPNTIAGSQLLSSPSLGQASYAEKVEYFGALRGRLGYALGNWLLYGTSGFAWTRDQFTRTQLMGTPVGGSAVPGTAEMTLQTRAGWTVGAGVETPFLPNWTANLEYLYSDFGATRVTFPAGAQSFDGDLTTHEIRLGFNYRPSGAASALPGVVVQPTSFDSDDWGLHGQTTYIHQYAPPFRAPYHGKQSLESSARETWDATLFLGRRLWSGAELWVDPEIDQGFGLSNTLGVAGFVNGEAYKLGNDYPYARLPRMFLRQTIDLGGDSDKVDARANQLAGEHSQNRLILTLGKFAVVDIFDTNKYAHDPRSDFLNWALIDTGTFDYAADAWGYTYGTAVEWYQGPWTLRGGLFDLSIVPNSTDLDPNFSQFQMIGEIERRYDFGGQPGKLAATGFLSRGRMGLFGDAVELANATGQPADIAAVRDYRSRSGISFNMEQQLSADLGIFARAGFASGNVEPYEFTDIDRTLAAGLSLTGNRWGRPDHTVGFAGMLNGISGEHQAFLNAGGLGILVGDGKLPHPGAEQIIEAYYSLPVSCWRLTFDYQFIANPAYNEDRGPVSVFAARLHSEF